MKLLIIEDNRVLARSIKRFLANIFVVDLAFTAQEGLDKARAYPYDVILLDLHLPDYPGKKVCTQLREEGCEVSILVLTANARTKSCVTLLRAGADDYLTKPFNGAELQARLLALSRRQNRTYKSDILTINDLEIDVARRSVHRAGVRIPLRRKEFEILAFLVRNRGRAVTREMIIDHAWEAGKDGWSNSVDVHIKYLRDKIDRNFQPQLIKTAYGIGYMVDDTKS